MQNNLFYYKHIIPDAMTSLKLKQLQFEIDGWKRLFDFMTDENIQQKNRLAEILKDKFDKNLLGEVENFQSSFLVEDELIGVLRNEVAEMDKLLLPEEFNNIEINKETGEKLNILRENIMIAEKQFGNLKFEFNFFLSKNI